MNDRARDSGFILDVRLAADTFVVTDLPLSRVLLMDDSRFPWLILVPRCNGLSEVTDLDAAARAQLWRETHTAACALRQVAPCDKINIGALGNIVQQLHVHVVARNQGDAAWPGPVWGYGCAERYPSGVAGNHCQRLRDVLSRDP